ncbi:hypothetical protein GCM10007160_32590 [Litchfieldella qijiaojingensis]|uniref:Uncharacterized protein n=1 Tax=Litchfieldella qijiaojingensis TaxID=980347 RepID=A0ABQ2Z2F0_9GAMM|nr:hypothetical protein [Halomonas qijiaojingensis]GGY02117.1 hypothetical protein GCM10007160_32590 [Halomonas qijiaojingensis]
MPDQEPPAFSAWHPGLEAELPKRYQALETIHQAANVYTFLADIHELKTLTGLAEEELVAFRVERLMLHELIVQVAANIVVPEGEEEEALGWHFRQVTHKILSDYLAPELPAFQQAYDELYDRIHDRVGEILSAAFQPPAEEAAPTRPSFLSRCFSRRKTTRQRTGHPSIQERHYGVIKDIKDKGLAARDDLDSAIYKSTYRILSSIASTQGYIGLDQGLLKTLITRHVCNDYGSSHIGRKLAPHVERAMQQEGYSRIPCAREPILISLKGASAAGKSSLRFYLKDTLRDLGIQPDQYGTITPDIWRRLLLDYESLGEAYKYAGHLSGKEVRLIDAKLDRYIRDKAQRDRTIPHLVIDRFRFDSFSSEQVSRILDATYARYVATMYIYFIVTPPEATVERGWNRGLTRGRYKAVEDFLGHCVEAYNGMPKLFFKWLDSRNPRFKYFFLDNDVPKHTRPATIAYGTREELNVLKPTGLVNIDRYKKINTLAKCPAEVYPGGDTLALHRNCEFLKQCIAKVPVVNFIDEASGKVYLRATAGRFSVVAPTILRARREERELAELFSVLAVPER